MEQDETSQRREPEQMPLHAPPTYKFPQTPDALLPWSHALERLERARSYWLATTRPDGRPHVTPLWGVWVDGALYFDGLPTTQWASNLAKNPAAAIHLESGDDVVILEGAVDDLETSAELAAHIIQGWDAKYGRLHPKPAEQGIFRFRPRTARGWSTSSLADGTRWQFDAG
jgi:Pyridoxamine 5'-phosphate oxidase